MIKKTCTTCGVPKPWTADYFNKNRKSRDGFRHDCRICQARAFRDYKATKATERYQEPTNGR